MGSKDEGAAPEIDSQIDPDITLDIILEYQPRDRPMIPESARAEFLADHLPEKSGACTLCSQGRLPACLGIGAELAAAISRLTLILRSE